MSLFEDLRKGYETPEDAQETAPELSDEDKRLLDTKDIETLTARARMRLAYLRSKGGKSNE